MGSSSTFYTLTIPDTMLEPFPVAGTAVTWTVSSVGSALDGSAVVYTTTSAAAVSDPVTRFGDQKYKFWLPIGELTNLIQTPDLIIFASTFQGPSEDLQWFDRFLITRPAPDFARVAQVDIRRAAASVNASTLQGRNLRKLRNQKLQVRLGNTEMPTDFSEDAEYRTVDDIRVAFFSRHHGMRAEHGTPRTEFVQIQSPSISFAIFPSHAGNEFRGDAEMREKFVHLDMMTMDMVGIESFVGVLPEIWGLKPRSPAVEEYLIAPSERNARSICFEGTSNCPRLGVA